MNNSYISLRKLYEYVKSLNDIWGVSLLENNAISIMLS